MSLEQGVRYLIWAVYLAIFVRTAITAAARPLRPQIDTALLFLTTTVVIAIGVLGQAGIIQSGPLSNALSTSFLLAQPYFLLRLANDFGHVPPVYERLTLAALLLLVVVSFAVPPPRPGWYTIATLGYLVVVEVYAAIVFIREARSAGGVTRRRVQAAAAGSLLLALALVTTSLQAVVPAVAELWRVLFSVLALASGIAYYAAFATPMWLRRAWQEPELRAFLVRASILPRLSTVDEVIRAVEDGAAASLGAAGASVGLYDASRNVLRFRPTEVVTGTLPDSTALDHRRDDLFEISVEHTLAGRSVTEQLPVYSSQLERDDPALADAYDRIGARTLLAAPITAGERRLGVLGVYARREALFIEDDLALVQLLANQAAVVLESRSLIDEAARVQAESEANRLRDDFLSAAAHDLKTPLTVLLAQSQMLVRYARRYPDRPVDLQQLERIERESTRMRQLVEELLDARRVEEGKLVEVREEIDLGAVARETCARHQNERHGCIVEVATSIVGQYDGVRIRQLLDNLVENAIKYSPERTDVFVRVWSTDGEARIEVSDQGIGIPSADLPRVFDRFYRAGNVNDRQYPGMGLGLYICRGIAEEHGGRIWVTSVPGQGTTFHVSLPMAREGVAHAS